MSRIRRQFSWQVSLITTGYSVGLVLFSLVARDVYSSLVQGIGREGVEVLMWGIAALLLGATFPLMSSLHRPAVGALFALALLAGLYAGSFEILEERTHLLKYGTLALLLCRDNSKHAPLATAIMALSGVLWVGSLDELVQSFTPGRVGDVRDVWFNLVGGVFGVTLWIILRWGRSFRLSVPG